jgi:uncharacterized protein (DUF2252 family)
MTALFSYEEGVEQGRLARSRVPRSSHEAIGDVRRDPIELLKMNSAGRVDALVPLRYGRMLASPFTFFRGSAVIQAHDLATTPDSGIHLQICGDCHLSNFGGFATPERTLAFDLNDFDETAHGPWEWDLKRLVASFVVAARFLGHGDAAAAEFAFVAAQSYQNRMQQYAGMGALDLWYERITFEGMYEAARTDDARRRLKRDLARAPRRTHETMLPKLAEDGPNGWRIRDAPPAVFHVHGRDALFTMADDWMKFQGDGHAKLSAMFDQYLATMSADRAALLASRFTVQDLAFKVVGVGSVGTRCMILLLTDTHAKPLFLQIKEASASVVSIYFNGHLNGEPAPGRHEGRRVVEGQRLMQAATDPFLGWSTGPLGRAIYIRQLRDMKISPEVELFRGETFREYAALCGWVLARAHAKAGGCAPAISGYLGKGTQMAEALVRYASSYADQVQEDYELFRTECREGRLEARTDADMAADFSV